MNFTTKPEIDRALALTDDVPALMDDVRLYVATIRELVQAVNAGILTDEQRAELGGQLLAQADVLTEFAFRVLA